MILPASVPVVTIELLISPKLIAVVGVRTSDASIGCTELVRTVVAVEKQRWGRKRKRAKLLIVFRGA